MRTIAIGFGDTYGDSMRALLAHHTQERQTLLKHSAELSAEGEIAKAGHAMRLAKYLEKIIEVTKQELGDQP